MRAVTCRINCYRACLGLGPGAEIAPMLEPGAIIAITPMSKPGASIAPVVGPGRYNCFRAGTGLGSVATSPGANPSFIAPRLRDPLPTHPHACSRFHLPQQVMHPKAQSVRECVSSSEWRVFALHGIKRTSKSNSACRETTIPALSVPRDTFGGPKHRLCKYLCFLCFSVPKYIQYILLVMSNLRLQLHNDQPNVCCNVTTDVLGKRHTSTICVPVIAKSQRSMICMTANAERSA